MDRLPHYRPPAILFPHGVVGNSASGIAPDVSKGNFGPFGGQLFVSDQTHSVVNRCFLEKVDGYYQSFATQGIRVRKALPCRLPWKSYFEGTDRGWGKGRQKVRSGSGRLEWKNSF